MHDNKVRLSRDVLEKAEVIAAEWGLKNARAAVEAVFRRYCDDYLYGRDAAIKIKAGEDRGQKAGNESQPSFQMRSHSPQPTASSQPQCEALDALDELLAL
ncbi:MAG TPA: hypothetical protein V6D07_11265 [Trichocoleus sp.]